MEDGVKEDPAQCKEMRFLAKAGWLKKAPGRLLASYKDRYIHVLKTELVVYENEDLQNCLERLDLENYDQCHELKTPFKKKHRLILIRSARSGNKVHDVKFQAQTAEEKDAWIKVLTDGINRAKNKVFDEVKVDESSNLEHVTRTRPKGNRNRRPPTRIHMKEVAVVSSDGILRLDLDLEDTMPNGAPLDNMEGTETPKEAVKVPTPLPSPSNATEKESGPSAEEGAQTEPEVSPKKKVIKPPMPPTKEAKSSSAPEDEPDKDCPHKKVPDEASTESPGTRKRTGPPPTLPNKPSSSISLSILAEASQASPNSQPPNPPSKEKKPSHPAVDPDLGVQGTAAENEGKDNRKKSPGTAMERDESPSSEVQGPEEELGGSSSPCPPLIPKKNPDAQKAKDSPTVREPRERQEEHTVSPHTASDGSDSSLQEQLTPLSHSINLSPLLCLPAQKKKKAEEKSVDSGQHSDDESEGSGSEDALAASAAALRGGHVGLDLMDASEDNIEISVGLRPIQVTTESQVRSKASHSPHSKPSSPLKASTKAKSASIGDLLADSSICTQSSQHVRAEAGSDTFPADDVMKLETEVALEREKTGELLSRVSQSQSRGDSEGLTEDLLAKALEKLERAELVLREVRKLKLTKNSRDRKSW